MTQEPPEEPEVPPAPPTMITMVGRPLVINGESFSVGDLLTDEDIKAIPYFEAFIRSGHIYQIAINSATSDWYNKLPPHLYSLVSTPESFIRDMDQANGVSGMNKVKTTKRDTAKQRHATNPVNQKSRAQADAQHALYAKQSN